MEQSSESGHNITLEYIIKKYDSNILYYWSSARSNKNLFKSTRRWPITLGALISLLTTLSLASFIEEVEYIRIFFAVVIVMLATMQSYFNEVSRNQNWGESWQKMTIAALKLEKEKDRLLSSEPSSINIQAELMILHNLLINETETFFKKALTDKSTNSSPLTN